MESFNFDEINVFMEIIKYLFIIMCTIYSLTRITNEKNLNKFQIIQLYICIPIVAIITGIIRYISNDLNGDICLIILISLVSTKIINIKLGYAIISTIISLSLNYILFLISVILNYIVNSIYIINNDYLNLALILTVYIIQVILLFKIKRFNYGLAFLKRQLENEGLDMIILNISLMILFLFIMISNYDIKLKRGIFFTIIAFSIIMFITIQKSLQLYYKQKLLIQDLNETKEELKKKNEEIKELEQENLSFSKTSHSIAHKQKALEYKLNEILLKSEIAEEIDIRDKVEKLRKEITKNKAQIELTKTNIEEIDDMLKYMQSECTKNDIEFDLKIQGNIYHMVNNIIEKEDLEILLADHIKNAIIAIQNSDNTNKTILVKLGIINGVYSLHIYDSGIEFEVETLKNLGKKPSTTHADQGGTGMGFMNTFDTLKKYKASLIINEYGKPSKENYTKSISIEFDKKNEYKVISYRKQCEILSYLGSK